MSRGPSIAKGWPPVWKECRSSSTSCACSSGHRALPIRSS
ncbi:Uncharacterised protein [Bordetella pertussis]|nr:Uncharacterised protein [Bordetella pertussis]